jgi:hypothetical protein
MHLAALGTGPDGYRIEQSTDGEVFTEVATAWGPDFTVGNLAPHTEYSFRVRAFNGAGDSEYSNPDYS